MRGSILLMTGIICVLIISGCISSGPGSEGTCAPEYQCSADWGECVKPGVRIKVCIDTRCGNAPQTRTESCEYNETGENGSGDGYQDIPNGLQPDQDFDWEFNEMFTRCSLPRKINGSDYYRIEVYVTNKGYDDIGWEEWVVHKIDGIDEKVWQLSIRNVTSNVVSGVSGMELTQFHNYGVVMLPTGRTYAEGSHVIELGTSANDVRTHIVVCGNA
jgi:hypothetical protein